MSRPEITVLMPAYNAGRFIASSIRGILGQSFENFELLIVDDGSSDNTAGIVGSFRDSRIRLLGRKENRGLVFSLNEGLAESRGAWIARQDADDMAARGRLEMQLETMRANPGAVLCYSRAKLVDEHGIRRGTLMPPPDDARLRWDLCFRNAVPHTSAFFSRDLVNELEGYSGDNVTADYDLWSRLLHHGKGVGIDRPLVAYRNHSSSIMGRENASGESGNEGVASIMRRNLACWAGADEFQAHRITAAWMDPSKAAWREYFTISQNLAERNLDLDSKASLRILAEEDYTLFHRALANSRDSASKFLGTMKKIVPERHRNLPLFRTMLSRIIHRSR